MFPYSEIQRDVDRIQKTRKRSKHDETEILSEPDNIIDTDGGRSRRMALGFLFTRGGRERWFPKDSEDRQHACSQARRFKSQMSGSLIATPTTAAKGTKLHSQRRRGTWPAATRHFEHPAPDSNGMARMGIRVSERAGQPAREPASSAITCSTIVSQTGGD